MSQVVKYTLEQEKLLPYLRGNLLGTNALSSEVFHNLQKKEGEFYTLLYKDNMPEGHLYRFKQGGVGGTIRPVVSEILMKKMTDIPESVCIFDDLCSTYDGPCKDPVFSEIEMHYGKEVYYTLGKSKYSKELVEKCLDVSSSVWHSLCVMSKGTEFSCQDGSLMQEDIASLVGNAELILIGAYDDESYIFWEELQKS